MFSHIFFLLFPAFQVSHDLFELQADLGGRLRLRVHFLDVSNYPIHQVLPAVRQEIFEFLNPVEVSSVSLAPFFVLPSNLVFDLSRGILHLSLVLPLFLALTWIPVFVEDMFIPGKKYQGAEVSVFFFCVFSEPFFPRDSLTLSHHLG